MDGSLSNKPKNFVDDPEKIYRQRRREARSKKPELVDPKVEADDSSSSPQATPPTSPKEASLHQGMALPEPERTIGELCTPDVRDLPIQNHRSSVRDQDFNHKDGAKLALHWKRRR